MKKYFNIESNSKGLYNLINEDRLGLRRMQRSRQRGE